MPIINLQNWQITQKLKTRVLIGWVHLFTWRKLRSLTTHWAHSEDSMPRLIWVFAGRTVIVLVFSWSGSIIIITAERYRQEHHNWTASSEFGTYHLYEQQRLRRACASAQSRQNLRCSLIQAVSQEKPSDRKSDPLPLWMAGHAQLKFVMAECSKIQIRLTGLNYKMVCYKLNTSRIICTVRLYSSPSPGAWHLSWQGWGQVLLWSPSKAMHEA